jgi:predicted unusual protein kinase regulating ubiquinone biosynthesis (AarF/ABC1/UbiB family)
LDVSGFVRASAFLQTEAALMTAERFGRGLYGGSGSQRALVIGTVAADVYSGQMALRGASSETREREHRRAADRVFAAAARLGGAAIKVCQFAATRPDLLPAPYIERLSGLRDRVPPTPWKTIEAVLARELGRPPSEVFSKVDPKPVAAASLAQVHRARLPEGREVALKVQYPEVAGLVDADLRALESVFDRVSRFEPEIQLNPLTEYLRHTLPLELDFAREARAAEELRQTMADRKDLLVPEILGEHTTGRLVVLEWAGGIKITDRQAILESGFDLGEVARLLNELYTDQLFNRGILHADPHPGNLVVQPGPRLALLDHGLTLRLSPQFVSALAEMVISLSEGDVDSLVVALEESGARVEGERDLETLLQIMEVLLGAQPGSSPVSLGEFGRALGSGIGYFPPDLLLVGRAIGLLDGITRQLDPELDTLEIAAQKAHMNG